MGAIVLRPNLDAGANIGLASIYYSLAYSNSRIIAFEPEESNLELLKRKYLLLP